MDLNWKSNLIKELEDYPNRLSGFLSKYNNDDFLNVISESLKNTEEIVKQQIEFNNKINRMISSLKNSKKNNSNKIYSKLINDQIKELDNEKIIVLSKEQLLYDGVQLLEEYVKDYSTLAFFGSGVGLYKQYKHICEFLLLAGLMNKKNSSLLAINEKYYNYFGPNEDYAKDCAEAFDDYVFIKALLEDVKDENPTFKEKNIFINCPIHLETTLKSNKVQLVRREDHIFYFLSPDFIATFKDYLDNNQFSSVVDLAIRFKEEMGTDVDDRLLRLKKLYELSNDQILIYDQRYYSEKAIKERNRQAELDRQQRYELEQERLEQEREFAELEEERYEEEEYENWKLERERNALLEEQNRIQQREIDNAERRHREQLAMQKKQANAALDAQIAQLEKERRTLHNPGDDSRRIAVESQIRDLESKKQR